MGEKSIVCPSGLSGRVRGLKGKELNLLGDKKAIRSGDMVDNLLRACWIETSDLGPYDFENAIKWGDVLVSDRFFILLQIRNATYPDEPYSFRTSCSDDNCGESFVWEVNLSDLPVKAVPPESIEKFQNKEPLEVTVNGKRVQFRLTTGNDERKAAKFLRGMQQRILEVLNIRLVSIEGVEQLKKKAWLEDLDMGAHRDMVSAFDSCDGGVETDIEVECPECGHVFAVDLPFGKEFFLPKRRRKDS